ncbi:hypothetical protein [Endozoicomonas sp.]|uniref:hypothetical protein n=1 Tax=Endozoicomonas sp. TaxID=1892382 RepID=UPI002888AAF3|nr:hypothetical protein [Endozoicomonas sp.]
MNIIKSAQNIIKVFNITLALSFASYLHAEQHIVASVDYNTPYSDSAFSFKEQQHINEDRVGSFLYKTIDDPDKVRNQVAGSAILYGLDSMGLGDDIREGINFIKKNTRYSFGDCGNIRLKTEQITATSCLSNGGSVEFNSDYDFKSVQLEFTWAI